MSKTESIASSAAVSPCFDPDNAESISKHCLTSEERERLPVWAYLFVGDENKKETWFFPYRDEKSRINKPLMFGIRRCFSAGRVKNSKFKDQVKISPKVLGYFVRVCRIVFPGLPDVKLHSTMEQIDQSDLVYGSKGIDMCDTVSDVLEQANLQTKKYDSESDDEELRQEQAMLAKEAKKRAIKLRKDRENNIERSKKAKSIFKSIQNESSKKVIASKPKTTRRNQLKMNLLASLSTSNTDVHEEEPTNTPSDPIAAPSSEEEEDEEVSLSESEPESSDDSVEIEEHNKNYANLVLNENKIAKKMLKRKKKGLFEEEANEEEEIDEIGDYGLGNNDKENEEQDLYEHKLKKADLELITDEVTEKKKQLEKTQIFHHQQMLQSELNDLERLNDDIKNKKLMKRRRPKFLDDDEDLSSTDEEQDLIKRYKKLDQARIIETIENDNESEKEDIENEIAQQNEFITFAQNQKKLWNEKLANEEETLSLSEEEPPLHSPKIRKAKPKSAVLLDTNIKTKDSLQIKLLATQSGRKAWL